MAIQQYAEIEAEETTDIDDIANTKDKNELAIFGARILHRRPRFVAGGEKR